MKNHLVFIATFTSLYRSNVFILSTLLWIGLLLKCALLINFSNICPCKSFELPPHLCKDFHSVSFLKLEICSASFVHANRLQISKPGKEINTRRIRYPFNPRQECILLNLFQMIKNRDMIKNKRPPKGSSSSEWIKWNNCERSLACRGECTSRKESADPITCAVTTADLSPSLNYLPDGSLWIIHPRKK